MSYLSIDFESLIPIYEQIIAQVKVAILDGSFQKGDPLPPVRQLATDLELNPNTVAKSYKTLEREGLILTAGRKGSFIAEDALERLQFNEKNSFEREVSKLVREAKNHGISERELIKLINGYYKGV